MSDDDKRGYGHPPKEHQFRSGEDGNRNGKGRPKGSKNRKTIVREIACERHRVTENGRKVIRTTAELLLHGLRMQAFAGNRKALKYYYGLLERHDETEDTTLRGGFLFLPGGVNSMEDWVRLYGAPAPEDESP